MVTGASQISGDTKDRTRDERLAWLRMLILSDVHLPSEPVFPVEFGSAPEKILHTAAAWNVNLSVLVPRYLEEVPRGETTWAKAYEIVSQASCPC